MSRFACPNFDGVIDFRTHLGANRITQCQKSTQFLGISDLSLKSSTFWKSPTFCKSGKSPTFGNPKLSEPQDNFLENPNFFSTISMPGKERKNMKFKLKLVWIDVAFITLQDDDDCFYYRSWRNNVVIAFGTLSSFLT